MNVVKDDHVSRTAHHSLYATRNTSHVTRQTSHVTCPAHVPCKFASSSFIAPAPDMLLLAFTVHAMAKLLEFREFRVSV